MSSTSIKQNLQQFFFLFKLLSTQFFNYSLNTFPKSSNTPPARKRAQIFLKRIFPTAIAFYNILVNNNNNNNNGSTINRSTGASNTKHRRDNSLETVTTYPRASVSDATRQSRQNSPTPNQKPAKSNAVSTMVSKLSPACTQLYVRFPIREKKARRYYQ